MKGLNQQTQCNLNGAKRIICFSNKIITQSIRVNIGIN